jgi:Protein of unknown function (DUF2802)
MHVELSDWIYGLRALLLLAAFAGLAWALVRFRRQAAQSNAQLAARLETALVEIHRLSGQVTALGGTIESLATRLQQANSQRAAPAPAPAAVSVNTRGYETAIRMARSGASVEEIVASGGTTRAEAKLLRRLHECGDPRKADAETMKIA